MGRGPGRFLLLPVLLGAMAAALTSDSFMDCPVPLDNNWGLLRKCCRSPQLPNGCECFDISKKSQFVNSLYHKPQCPDQMAVRFLLYTRLNRDYASVVKVGDSSLPASPFQATKPTKIIIHGFTDFAPSEWNAFMVEAILNLEDVNVVLVDWRDGARGPNYFQGVANTRSTGAMVARLIQEMYLRHGTSLGSFHLIGHSLGAHVCGIAGKEVTRLTSGMVGRISGLDPAGFCFDKHSPNVRLDKSDAVFVDVIHTDAQPLLKPGFGIQHSIGHVDFYANGGKHQPGCPTERGGLLAMFHFQHFDSQLSAGSCSHSRCLFYYINSISQCVPPPAVNGRPRCIMGYHTNPLCRGDFFPQTTDTAPYC